MAQKKKAAPAQPNALQVRENHPIRLILDFHEEGVKRLLKTKGDEASGKIKIILPAIERVRRHLSSEDAASAAVFMYELAVKLERAGLSRRGEKRQGFKIDRRWLDRAISIAILRRPGANRTGLWTYFKNKHNGPDNALEVEGSGFAGAVHWEPKEVGGCLFYNDGGDGQYIDFETFRKRKISPLKK